MSNTEKPMGTWHDCLTGETITRELTAEEIAELPQPRKMPHETPTAD